MIDRWELADFDALLDGGLATDDDGTSPLRELGRRITGQVVDILVPFAQEVFRGAPGDHAVAALADATAALRRLVAATQDAPLADHLDQLPRLVERARDTHPGRRSAFLGDMRRWILGMSNLLTPEDGEQLRAMVDSSDLQLPLLDHLMGLPGVGRRRIQRLYCAGLYTPEALASAVPSDVTMVTGIPLGIVQRCIEASAAFAERQLATHIDQLKCESKMVLDLLRRRSDDTTLVSEVTTALTNLEVALARLRPVAGGPDGVHQEH